MADEQEPTVEAIRFEKRTVLVVEAWPQRIAVTDEWLRYAHVHKARVDGDTVTITAGNGKGVYLLRRDLPRHGDAVVADLQEGDTPGRLKQKAQKFKPAAGEDA